MSEADVARAEFAEISETLRELFPYYLTFTAGLGYIYDPLPHVDYPPLPAAEFHLDPGSGYPVTVVSQFFDGECVVYNKKELISAALQVEKRIGNNDRRRS